MKLGSLKHPKKLDGEPVVVSRDNKQAVKISHLVPSIREAIETWSESAPKLQKIYDELNAGQAHGAFAVDENSFHSPLPRAFQWVDGSAYIQHVKLVRKARNAPLPETLLTVPLMYQGGSDTFLAPREDIPQIDFGHGTDFEGEVAVVTSFVPMGTKPKDALKHILLVLIVNDVSL
ncbi:MAG TPA: fumarylacetoacetate hydrolase family protein, partial [Bdellovibrionales bacterium]|nr:fumarylacetoacetate hydrolase family protein [Bdellovibrionales bacterium]